MSKQDLKVRGEHKFEDKGRIFTMRHYSDDSWELLDENGLPICQGYCSDEGQLDTSQD